MKIVIAITVRSLFETNFTTDSFLSLLYILLFPRLKHSFWHFVSTLPLNSRFLSISMTIHSSPTQSTNLKIQRRSQAYQSPRMNFLKQVFTCGMTNRLKLVCGIVLNSSKPFRKFLWSRYLPRSPYHEIGIFTRKYWRTIRVHNTSVFPLHFLILQGGIDDERHKWIHGPLVGHIRVKSIMTRFPIDDSFNFPIPVWRADDYRHKRILGPFIGYTRVKSTTTRFPGDLPYQIRHSEKLWIDTFSGRTGRVFQSSFYSVPRHLRGMHSFLFLWHKRVKSTTTRFPRILPYETRNSGSLWMDTFKRMTGRASTSPCIPSPFAGDTNSLNEPG